MTGTATPPSFPPPSQAPPGAPAPAGAAPHRRLVVAATAVAVVAVAALAVLAVVGNDDAPVATAPSTAAQPRTGTDAAVSSRWETAVGAEIGWPTVLLSGSVVVPTKGGSVLSLDRDDGAIRWRHDLAPADGVSLGIAPGADLGVLGAGATLTGVNLDDGQVRWRAAMPGTVTAIEPLGSTAAVGGAGFAAVVDVATGDTLWSTYLPGAASRSGRQRVARIVPVGELLLVRSVTSDESDVAVWALTRGDGRVRWQLDELPIALGLTHTSDGALVLVSWKQGVSAFAASTGDRVWHRPRSTMTWFSGTIAQGVLIGDRAGSALLDVTTGKPRWALTGAWADVAGDSVWARAGDAYTGLDPGSGAARWRLPGRFGPWAVTEDRIVALADDGRVILLAAADGDVVAEIPGGGSSLAATALYADDAGAVLMNTAAGRLRYVPFPS